MSTNNTYGWKIENPEWRNYSKQIFTPEHRWYGMYGTSFWLSNKQICDRYMFGYPNIAEHFYYLWLDDFILDDIIFASYDLEEVKKFISQLGWKNYYHLEIYDEPANTRYKVIKQDDIQNDGYNFIVKELNSMQ